MEQTRRSPSRKKLYRRQALLGWLFSLAVAGALLYVLFGLWLTPVRVAGDTMAPALENDQVVLVDRAARFVKAPTRGDVILFADPLGTGDLIKRVVALPGETVDIKAGRVYIDGCPLDESAYLNLDAPAGDMDPVTVPDGCVFVLGDNRAEVYDSRTEGVGCIPYQDIRGVVRVRILPASALALYF
ncbi:MAG TPA: signal peptidase I [Candidatus Aphodomorpha intestinavium]|uniref:Signal peptidase I n=1 Tax=Candidatus Aphodomorpha intestinavium TaxID=2840672 RepID=A0A9D1STD7_9FIRM|nr:signal peptidase I [Candidatus Aphodomorpha intestinavium]